MQVSRCPTSLSIEFERRGRERKEAVEEEGGEGRGMECGAVFFVVVMLPTVFVLLVERGRKPYLVPPPPHSLPTPGAGL